MSAIDRALSNLDIQSDVSGIGVSKQLLLQGRKAKSSLKPNFNVPNNSNNSKVKSLSPNNKKIEDEILNAEAEMISENKENLDPDKFRSSSGIILSDTISFNESLLNSSEMKQLQKSISQCRSPLSPIDIVSPNMRVHHIDEGEEVDNDEWSTSPATRNKRIHRSKSPRDKSPVSLNAMIQASSDAKTPVNSISSRSNAINKNKTVSESTSLSSTRVDSRAISSNKDSDFRISPDISKGHSSVSSSVIRGNTLTVPQREEIVSPSRSDNSPFSSPRSCNQSKASSPTPIGLGFQSPNHDTTNNSDRQKLSAATKRKVISSPAGSEASSTCSYSTIQTYRSGMSGVCGRNVSRCSSTSEFSHRDGKPIPLKVTNTELSWGSVKLRSDSRKSMQIKNISDKRLVIRIEVNGPGFQIVNSQRSNTLTLYSQECRSISINFCPTVRGVAIGKLSFFAPGGASTTAQSFLDVPLYGYGGTASVLTQNVCLAPMGLPFVTMGDVCELGQPLERTISFYNKGPLLGFASVSIDFVGLKLPRLSEAFEIHPKKILIPPKHVVDIRIVFRPKKEEVRKIIKKIESVSTVANMRVICGDEANRQRIRRLLAQMPHEERSLLTSSSLDNLWTAFPQETEMKDLDDMKENPEVAKELLSQFRIHEILLTINHDRMDDTVEASSIFLPDVDDTVLFRTICTTYSPTPSSNLGTVDEHLEEEADDDGRSVKITKHGSFSVSPKSIELSLSKKENVTLSVINRCKSRQFFEISCNLKDILHCSPSGGYIASEGGQTEINVHLNYLDKPLDNVYVIVSSFLDSLRNKKLNLYMNMFFFSYSSRFIWIMKRSRYPLK
ncbi:hypothetical protein DOY81_001318 [Sarcophaga bullata]|nr:hypothetical protein DOY81_001318 [Sarcophaga bullata]